MTAVAAAERPGILRDLIARGVQRWWVVDVDQHGGDGYRFVTSDGLCRFNRRPRRPEIPDVLRLAVYERDGYACLECGAHDRLSLDHIWPYSLGGQDTYTNLQTLCLPCNSSKGARV